jgi:hypothetical protein
MLAMCVCPQYYQVSFHCSTIVVASLRKRNSSGPKIFSTAAAV